MQPVTCEGCGLTGLPSQVTMYQMVTGWRRLYPRSTVINNKRFEQRFMCHACLSGGLPDGPMWEQPRLFPVEP